MSCGNYEIPLYPFFLLDPAYELVSSIQKNQPVYPKPAAPCQLLNPVRPKQIPSNTSLNSNCFQISTALKRKSARTLLLMLAQTLQVDKLKVSPTLSDQLAMRAVLHDPTLVEDVNHVGFLDGRQPVRDGDGGPTAGRGV